MGNGEDSDANMSMAPAEDGPSRFGKQLKATFGSRALSRVEPPLPIPCSLFPAPYSLLPIPCSLFPAVAHFCFQPPPASWYHQPPWALSTHCLANTARSLPSQSGWPLATATSRYRALRSRLS